MLACFLISTSSFNIVRVHSQVLRFPIGSPWYFFVENVCGIPHFLLLIGGRVSFSNLGIFKIKLMELDHRLLMCFVHVFLHVTLVASYDLVSILRVFLTSFSFCKRCYNLSSKCCNTFPGCWSLSLILCSWRTWSRDSLKNSQKVQKRIVPHIDSTDFTCFSLF